VEGGLLTHEEANDLLARMIAAGYFSPVQVVNGGNES
jgi:hypothetical protein